MLRRLFFFLLLVSLVLWVHPLVAVIISIVLSFIYHFDYYEMMIIGVIIDVAYQSILNIGIVSVPLYTTVTVILFFIVRFAKRRMNIYA